jgi:ABC-type transporter Mla maintaining outer membrane lipid asymmetry permease subunit MlaE
MRARIYFSAARIFVLFFLLVAAVYAASLVYDLVATAQLDGGVPFSWAHFLGLYIRTLVNGLLTAMMSGAVIAVVIASFAQYDGATTTTTEVSITHATTVATQEGEHDPE